MYFEAITTLKTMRMEGWFIYGRLARKAAPELIAEDKTVWTALANSESDDATQKIFAIKTGAANAITSGS